MKTFIATLVREVITAATKAFAEEGARKLATKWFSPASPPKKDTHKGCRAGHP